MQKKSERLLEKWKPPKLSYKIKGYKGEVRVLEREKFGYFPRIGYGIFLESELWPPPPCIKNVQKKCLTILDNKINLTHNNFL